MYMSLSVMTSTSDKLFSTLWQLKKYLQNTTGHGQLNRLALLNNHRGTEISAIYVLK
jgi:hypothetical protein